MTGAGPGAGSGGAGGAAGGVRSINYLVIMQPADSLIW